MKYILKLIGVSLIQISFLDEIPITIEEREPQKFINSTGTRIQIRNIEQWNKRKFRETYRQIVSLNSPFESQESFKVNIKVHMMIG